MSSGAPAQAGRGRVETLSAEFVSGWAQVHAPGKPAFVYATVRDEVLGFGAAKLSRPDLDKARQEGRLDAHAFMLTFKSPVAPSDINSIQVFAVGQPGPLPQAKQLKLDRTPTLRLFLMGSPRSGTSQLGATLTKVLSLPWLGEGHGAPLFSRAADALTGDRDAENGLVRHMARENFRRVAIDAARAAYFHMHGSASFVDKTPGVPMIAAAPFLLECFPDARFIFQRRNPIANIRSRMVKFGGGFEEHCRDWAAAMNEWLRVRTLLPHFVEVQQEDMLAAPDRVARVIADYIGVPDAASRICDSLRTDRLEQTGAGAGVADRNETGWSEAQLQAFDRICGPAMRAFGYI
ncbi:MAG: sulfotransferase [Proteobacteria bacterium]|nr:sulfotransferase [Pseudomonadota bacterium]